MLHLCCVAIGNLEQFNLASKLFSRVQEGNGYSVSSSDIAELYKFPIDRFQSLAIDGFLNGSSVVVCAPTSSGKTLIAEAAAAATLAKQKRILYTTPLKALSNQKLREFRKMFGDSNVGLLTGDAAVNREAPIVVMTTEILRNMLYRSVGNSEMEEGSWMSNVIAVVLDEVHYLSDISRGTVWEETVIYCPKKVQLICLSATIANPQDLARWIAQVHGPTELVLAAKRPVPLQWHFSTRFELLPLLNAQGTEMNRKLALNHSAQDRGSGEFWDEARDETSPEKSGRGRKGFKISGNLRSTEKIRNTLSDETLNILRRKQVPLVRDTLMQLVARDMLPAIWFIFSRRGCDTAVHYIQDVELLSEEESRTVQDAIERFEELHPDAVRDSARKPLMRGVAAHHAGCLPAWKSFVEELFQKGLVKVVFATETLSAGINMPARTTVLSSLSKRGDVGHTLLSSNAMLQMGGRAGRRGIDKQGHVVVVQTPFEGAEECCKLLFAGPDPLISQFTASYGMALNLLAGGSAVNPKVTVHVSGEARVLSFGRSLNQARELIEQSFGSYLGSEVVVAAKQQLSKFQQELNWLVQRTGVTISLDSFEGRISSEQFNVYLEMKTVLEDKQRELKDAESPPREMRDEFVALRQKLKKTQGYKEVQRLLFNQKQKLDRISWLNDKAAGLSARISQMQLSGWNNFLQVVEVLNAAGAINMCESELLPLGQIAAALRGENELWLALVFSSPKLSQLSSVQLAGVCAALVSDGFRSRSDYDYSSCGASDAVLDWAEAMDSQRMWLLTIQDEFGLQIPVEIDTQIAGLVEAWASGVSWKELMIGAGMDEGDVARLLRRSIDLLAQIPHLPHMDSNVAKLARQAADIMDRPPISELLD